MAERNDYQPEDIDCFFYQYQIQCEERQCRFLHRDSCKLSADVCLVWHEHKKCTNRDCPQKHLNHETLRRYFLCDQEYPNHCCKRESCHMYHEKVSYINGCYRSANEIPVLAGERRIERNTFMDKNYSQTQMSLKSAMQFIKISVEFIQRAVGSKKLSRERGKRYVKEVVDLEKSNITELILDTLSSLNTQMTVEENPQEGRGCGNVFCYVSTVVSCCFFYNLATKQKTDNYFGASVSCSGRHQRELMIDILCYHTWNEDISLAVCLTAERMNTGLQQAIQFRPIVCSRAYQMKNNSNMQTRIYSVNGKHQQHTPIPPCRKCLDMFPDIGNNLQQQNNDRAFWPYGNCAEVESLSRLLNAHGYVCNRMPAPVGVRFTLQFLKRKKRGRIIHNLKLFNFHVGNNILFYTPDDLQNAV
ncbi:uncharacterized protein LOC125463697 isoform X2 [Stegostoma tigrinum]|uniref:uncharacterized protein LOC125463697 isoform X2 n=1 Tax=Stegostoma tigrinum TaxID=3053191 RepID=UPI00202B1A22|nr:uncharacterized protein LOC125463697 isoform X2 [Stegostoma tigrinum]